MPYTIPSGQGTPLEMARMKFYPLSGGFIDVPGYPTPAATAFDGYELIHPRTHQANLGAPRTIPVTAQGRVQTTFILPSLDAQTGEAHLAYIDLPTFAILSATKTHTIGGAIVGGMGTNKQGLELSGILLVQSLKFHDEDGADAWYSSLYPRTQCVIQPPAVNETQADITVNMSFSASKKHVTGADFSEATHGFLSAVKLPVVSWGQLNLVAWLADGVEDTFLLPTEAPANETYADTFKVYNTSTGSLVTGTPAADQFVAGAAPADGVVLLGWYEQVESI